MISIIIPVYNSALYLADMLDSVLNQSYKDYEIILVNDGSKDSSGSICSDYAQRFSCIKYFDRQNQGVSATRNFGLDQAIGDFVWFMDSDDFLAEDALMTAVSLQERYNADVIIGGMDFCFSSPSNVVNKSIQRELVFSIEDFHIYYDELFSKNYLSSLWNKMLRRSVIVENGIRMLEKLQMYEDYIFDMDVLLKCNSVVAVPTVFYKYQIRGTQSLSHRYKAGVADMLKLFVSRIKQYSAAIGSKNSDANARLNNLVIYFAYECVKNEYRNQTNALRSVKALMRNEAFCEAMRGFRGFGRKYESVHFLMKNRMALMLVMYLRINRK